MLTSAVGVLAFLHEEETELQVFALRTLNDDIDTIWTEVADSIPHIESLFEDEGFPERQLAALLLAKVYYHLQEYNESMTFALAAGDLFKLENPGEFEETIISKFIDQYIAVMSARHAAPKTSRTPGLPTLSTSFSAGVDGSALISPTTPFSHSTLPSKSLLSRVSTDNTILDPTYKEGRSGSVTQLPDRAAEETLNRIVERLFEACLRHGQYKQVVGIAVEARNLSVLRRVIQRASDDEKAKAEELMEYALGICMDIVQERSLRTELLRLILDLLNDIPNPDYFAIARCVVYLDADEEASTMLRKLVETGDRRSLANAYQIAFDLYDNGTQEFLGKIIKALPLLDDKVASAATATATATTGSLNSSEDDEDSQDETEVILLPPPDASDLPEPAAKVFRNIRSILVGTKTVQLNLEFLYRNNRTDLSILNKVRDCLEGRNSIFHTAVTFCNAFMNQGTTNDKFFRDNLEWLGKAVNWSKFTATAALGVIHRGNLTQSHKLLEPYLPRVSGTGLSTGSPYSQGGALYAYGLIHANHGADALDYLRTQFGQAEDEIILHGGALGLGIAGMATGDDDIFKNLKLTMFTDSALNGEAVGLAMGLIMLGTGNVEALEDMIKYAHETNHEKTVRGLAVGMALIMYGRQEGADELIDGLLSDPDATLRYGGIMTVALAYCGTGSNKAVRRLLHVAVSDVSDDVRRVAVMSLGFILFRKPGSVPRMVELLAESYNPHVRYGSAMALGISCAGTGLDEAIDLLEPMTKDPTDFVRQGALISLAMIMIQQNEVMNPKVATIRKTLKKVVGDRHEEAVTKFGAAIALGILDAGGRNCTIGLQTQTGNLNMAGIVGMAVFLQYWYWFPFTHFLSLSFSPTAIIGLDADLDMPDFKVHCATRPSLFDYPPEQEVKADEGPAMIATAILSTTAQAKRRAQKKERAARRESMDVDPKGDKMDVDENKDKEKEEPKEDAKAQESSPAPEKKKPERVGYDIDNMARVLPGQFKYISVPAGRYKPVKKPTGGPILLVDLKPEDPKSLIEEKLKKVTTERAPVAGAAPGGGGVTDRPNPLLSALRQGGQANLAQLSSFLARAGAQEVSRAGDVVDEEGEADVPGSFDYYSEEEDDEDDS